MKVRIIDHKLGECSVKGCTGFVREMQKNIGRIIESEQDEDKVITHDGYLYSPCMYEKVGLDRLYDHWGPAFFSPTLLETTTQKIYQQTLKLMEKGGEIKKMLNLVAKKLLDPDLKVLVEAGILDDDLTIGNAQFILSFLVNQYKKELATEAKELLSEKKKEDEE